ncbi:hypothetical protein AO265_18055 [Pseudomonas sp. ABAC61]|nr:hypothetical protein AO265_18055 [Pseudomonas sp. ABAC61]
MQNTPLNAADFDAIEDTLLKYGDDHSVLNPCRQFIDLCVRHINSLAVQLDSDAAVFKARLEATEHQGQPLLLAEEWCFGYLRGVAVGNWPQMPAPQTALLQAITDCAEQDNFELPADLDIARHQQQVASIEPAARQLHQYWSSQR